MVSFSASVLIFLFTDAFFLNILLFCVLVSLDDFSYASYRLLLASRQDPKSDLVLLTRNP